MSDHILHFGDPHAKPDNLAELDRLVDFAVDSLPAGGIIYFAGDQYNDHGVVHVSVLDFWTRTYKKLHDRGVKSISGVGNHDLTTDFKLTPMSQHEAHTKVVGKFGYQLPQTKVAFLGFIKKNDEFIETALQFYSQGTRLIFCHAEFDGAKFESGMYCPNGIPLTAFPKDLNFVSGHIHDAQVIKDSEGNVRVTYPGTPRMLTRSDFDRKKGFLLVNHKEHTMKTIPIPMEVSEPFEHIIIESLDQIAGLRNSDRVYVDVKGNKEFIDAALRLLPEKVKARSIPDKIVAMRTSGIKESDGLKKSFGKYAEQYAKENNLSPDFVNKVYTDYLKGWQS